MQSELTERNSIENTDLSLNNNQISNREEIRSCTRESSYDTKEGNLNISRIKV